MKYITILAIILLTGCTAVPVKHSLPELPNELKTKCNTLKPVNESEQKLSELLKIVNDNYGFYYECMIKHESIVDWYSKQKKIHDDIHNRGN